MEDRKCSVGGCERELYCLGLCKLHYARHWRTGRTERHDPGTPIERFWTKVDKNGPDGCWLWKASTRRRYGRYDCEGKSHGAHRFAYELLVGPIPEGLTLDHLCRNTLCVNPAHLEPVTVRENILRGRDSKTHCKNGHRLSGDNVLIRNGRRRCRACGRAQWKRRRERGVV